MKWEYHFLFMGKDHNIGAESESLEKLDKLGEDRWELVQVVSCETSTEDCFLKYIFKREKTT